MSANVVGQPQTGRRAFIANCVGDSDGSLCEPVSSHLHAREDAEEAPLLFLGQHLAEVRAESFGAGWTYDGEPDPVITQSLEDGSSLTGTEVEEFGRQVLRV